MPGSREPHLARRGNAGNTDRSVSLTVFADILAPERVVRISFPQIGLDVIPPIVISVTLGELPDDRKTMDVYCEFPRGYDAATGLVEDEPRTLSPGRAALRLGEAAVGPRCNGVL